MARKNATNNRAAGQDTTSAQPTDERASDQTTDGQIADEEAQATEEARAVLFGTPTDEVDATDMSVLDTLVAEAERATQTAQDAGRAVRAKAPKAPKGEAPARQRKVKQPPTLASVIAKQTPSGMAVYSVANMAAHRIKTAEQPSPEEAVDTVLNELRHAALAYLDQSGQQPTVPGMWAFMKAEYPNDARAYHAEHAKWYAADAPANAGTRGQEPDDEPEPDMAGNFMADVLAGRADDEDGEPVVNERTGESAADQDARQDER